MSKVKELEKDITKMVNNFQPNKFKERAYQELSRVDLTKKSATRNIIQDYPDFDSICFKITDPDHFVIKIHINPEDLKNNPKAIKKCAKMISGWFKKGAR